MSVSIISCPKCQSLLLNDTVQCPTCQHVLRPDQADDLSDAELQSDRLRTSKEVECSECGEMVRSELVRCWNCGTFMRKEIAEAYERRQEASSDVTYSELPDGQSAATQVSPDDEGEEPGPVSVDDDDFELSSDIEQSVTQAPPAAAPTGPETGETPQAEPAEPAPAAPPSGEAEAEGASTEQTQPAEDQAVTADQGASAETEAPAGAAEDQPGDEDSDALLDIAMQEEQEAEKRRKQGGKRKRAGKVGSRGGFIVFCPNGCRIEVQERHRGKTGRCPRCKAIFHVPHAAPEQPGPQATAEPAGAESKTEEKAVGGKYNRWVADVRLHPLDPQKLKLKPGSLEAQHELVDVGFSPEEMLVVSLVKKGSLFGAGEKKKPEIRESMLVQLAEETPPTDLQVEKVRQYDADAARQISVVQPAVYAHESMFAGIPVFGDGRIAVRLPKRDEDGPELMFLAFFLSAFREFARHLSELFGVDGLGEDVGVPMTDQVTQHVCHYSEETFEALDNADFYQADPTIELKIVGRKCQECGLTVSEESRKKERLGGKTGRGIASAKCPKCKKKFGNITFYAREEVPKETGKAEEAAAGEEA